MQLFYRAAMSQRAPHQLRTPTDSYHYFESSLKEMVTH